ncbi:tRNA pseudouridine(38-40) synthase TruA [Natronobeatus ordinarius]|uniref:tRNA pseudouridine(38-40) synthase TruA n=1 Tax=Natronobeatus ordinarius TaxID=2963433 RepID=UPI0020CBBFC3|nr:tRNA pseudouridine(38-40) synthase TruA [Natronobeatus ordinarius]
MRAFRVAYDGTPYYGYQRQPDVPTVEDAIFDGLRDLEVLAADAGKPAGYAAAGRTDAGVSATCQTITLEAPDWLTPRAASAALPPSIQVWASAEAPDDFHATHHAVRRTYIYHLYAPPADEATAFADGIDDDRFAAALESLSGPADFHNFTPDDHNTERDPDLSATRDGDYLVVTVTAGGFARELVRRLVSLAHAIGVGDEPLEKVDRALSPDPLPGHEGIAPAPPEPLVLTHVEYPGLTFAVDEVAVSSARELFEADRLERRTGARISRMLRDGLRE